MLDVLNICIEFDSYIMHMTRNESYTSWDNYEVRKGNYLVDFEKSRFIDFYDDMGFLTSKNRFVGRREAYQIALACGQIKPRNYSNRPDELGLKVNPKDMEWLASEDLY